MESSPQLSNSVFHLTNNSSMVSEVNDKRDSNLDLSNLRLMIPLFSNKALYHKR